MQSHIALTIHPIVPTAKHFDSTEKRDVLCCGAIVWLRKDTRQAIQKATLSISMSSGVVVAF